MNGKKVKKWGLISLAVVAGIATIVKVRQYFINADKYENENNSQSSESQQGEGGVVGSSTTGTHPEDIPKDTYKNGATFFNSSLRAALRDPDLDDDDIVGIYSDEHNYSFGHASLHVRFKPESQRRPQHVQILCEIPRKAYMADIPKTSHPELLDGRVNPMTEFVDLQDEGGKEFTLRMFAEAFADKSPLLKEIKNLLDLEYFRPEFVRFEKQGYYFVSSEVNEVTHKRVTNIYRAYDRRDRVDIERVLHEVYENHLLPAMDITLTQAERNSHDLAIRKLFGRSKNPNLRKLVVGTNRAKYEPILEDLMLVYCIEFDIESARRQCGIKAEDFLKILKILKNHEFQGKRVSFKYRNVIFYVDADEENQKPEEEAKIYVWENTEPAKFEMSVMNLFGEKDPEDDKD